MNSVKKRLLFLVFCLAPLWASATHIVGGEFELIWIEGTRYRLNLVLYFDAKNGSPGALDPSVTAHIYRQSDNAHMRTVFLPRLMNTPVNYTQPECSNDAMITRRIFYSDSLLILNPTQFNHPAGYYISWERCCRNYSITNVSSLDPLTNDDGWAGQTFYLEFPAIQTPDGEPFIDSTPRLFPPLQDYACPYVPYYTNFGGIDDDGDSLVYSLVTPLSTKARVAFPQPGPKLLIGGVFQYPSVEWRLPFGLNNIMGGSPDLRISQDGFLTVTPGGLQGIYVFAVRVEEYRNQVKIGETRRDFQMLVIDKCPEAVPPQILGKQLSDPTYTHDETMNFLVTDANQCIQVRVSDNTSLDSIQSYRERVKLKAIGMNFKKDITSILPSVSYVVLDSGSVVEYTICFPRCPYVFGGPAEIGIIAMDDACSLPLTDTLKISVNVVPPPNTPPEFTSATPVTGLQHNNETGTYPYSAVDADGDPLIISFLTNGFQLSASGITFETLSQVPGEVTGQLNWTSNCEIFDLSQRTSFQVTVVAEDQDLCLYPNPVSAIYNLIFDPPPNVPPVIDSDLTANPLERTVNVTRRLQQDLNFTVTGTDVTDLDFLVLSSYTVPLTPGLSPLTIAPSPVTASSTVSTPASWSITCEAVDFSERDSAEYLLKFIVVDVANLCRIYKADTLDVNLLVLPPLNHAPSLSILNNNPTVTNFSDNTLTLTRGASIDLTFTGTDTDLSPQLDGLRLQLANQAGNALPPAQYSFNTVEGTSPLQGTFTWTPDCSIFRSGEASKEYQLSFELVDDHCQTGKKDSLTLRFVVNDVEGSHASFQPPNFVSPNGDDKNDYYAMERLIPETGELETIMPNDNCSSRFEYVRIYNRWGKEVFRSSDRDFKWFPGDTPPGTYYYTIKFTSKEYKGALTVMY